MEYTVRFTTASTDWREHGRQSGYGELVIQADSDNSALHVANATLSFAGLRRGEAVVAREIQRSDGRWYFFDEKYFQGDGHPQPKLQQIPGGYRHKLSAR